MSEYVVNVPEELEDELLQSFASGRIVEFTDQGAYVEFKKVQVDRLNGVKIEVFSNEHPPPHFRVKYQGSTANYSIKDCTRINGAARSFVSKTTSLSGGRRTSRNSSKLGTIADPEIVSLAYIKRVDQVNS